ncbi:hypothetical protein ACGFIF_32235 [Kribbella sp. NPDC049174]|uniref:hypothetical protein n=1 Tax=Kribbella sp. NPDC049174 TaxID=3364112 RepID=UPI00370FB3B3
MSELQEVNFSDLLQRPNETVEKLKASRNRALRVRRRGSEDDLVLTTVAQVTEEHEVVDLAVRVLRAVMSDPVLRSHTLLDILPRIFPWVQFLPPEDRVGFAQELVDVMEAGSDLGVTAPVLTLIQQWRNTAEIWADPELLAILRSPRKGDFGPVPRPTVE